ncbi:hypothetical protein RRG08_024709 [Elysia crispata]|uniref:Uncharacterized protein n=1 Tax=Elysia crispata TaxID=231223 RepID=A0AAE0YEJ1_9GAST|nr:hypothetical protein RRG08_024709 [Elysia crispata]
MDMEPLVYEPPINLGQEDLLSISPLARDHAAFYRRQTRSRLLFYARDQFLAVGFNTTAMSTIEIVEPDSANPSDLAYPSDTFTASTFMSHSLPPVPHTKHPVRAEKIVRRIPELVFPIVQQSPDCKEGGFCLKLKLHFAKFSKMLYLGKLYDFSLRQDNHANALWNRAGSETEGKSDVQTQPCRLRTFAFCPDISAPVLNWACA